MCRKIIILFFYVQFLSLSVILETQKKMKHQRRWNIKAWSLCSSNFIFFSLIFLRVFSARYDENFWTARMKRRTEERKPSDNEIKISSSCSHLKLAESFVDSTTTLEWACDKLFIKLWQVESSLSVKATQSFVKAFESFFVF